MNIYNDTNIILTIDNNEVAPHTMYEISENVFNSVNIFSDVGSITIDTEYCHRHIKCYGMLQAAEIDRVDEVGLKSISITHKSASAVDIATIVPVPVRPKINVQWSDGNDGKDGHYYIEYRCPGCNRAINLGYKSETACDKCGTFYDWSSSAEIRVTREAIWVDERNKR